MKLSERLFVAARYSTSPANASFLRESAQQARQLETADIGLDVRAAHLRFQSDAPAAPVPFLEAVNIDAREEYIREEFNELMVEFENRNMVGIISECIDLIYVCVGTLVVLGVPFKPFWAAIHAANMRKVPSGKQGGKWLKPEGWTAANIHKILYRLRNQAEGQE